MASRLDDYEDQRNGDRQLDEERRWAKDEREPHQPAHYLSAADYLERARIALDRAFVRADHPDYDTTAERDMDVKS